MLVCGNHRVSVKYQNDPDKILEMANKKPAYPPFGRDEVNVLNTCVNAGLEMEEGQRNYSVKGTEGKSPEEPVQLAQYMEDSAAGNAQSEDLARLHERVPKVKADREKFLLM